MVRSLRRSAPRVRALLGATHPEAALAVTAAMIALAAAAGLGARTALLGAAVLTGQLSIGWSNDWIDRGRDRAAGRDDKPLVSGAIGDAAVIRAALAALAACAGLSLLLGPAAGLLHLAAVSLGWLYNLWLKFTAASVLPYAGAFGSLPLVVGLAAGPGTSTPSWLVAAAACLGAGAHFVQVLPDLAVDADQQVHGLPQRLGARRSLVAAAGLLGTGAMLVAAGPGRDLGSWSAFAVPLVLGLVAAVVVAGLAGFPRLGFRLTLVVGLATVVMLVAGGSPYPT